MKKNNFPFAPLAQMIVLQELCRMNIDIQKLPNVGVYTAINKNKQLFFIGNYTNLMPNNYGIIFNNKYYVSQILKYNKISVAKSSSFAQFDKNRALLYAQEIGFPVILRIERASSLTRGIVKIKNTIDFIAAFAKMSQSQENILVEKYLAGESYRMLITSNGYYSILKKQLPNISGNGKSTVRELIDEENMKRINSSERYIQPLHINGEILQKYNVNFGTILKKRKKIVFSDLVSEKEGATFENITEPIHPSVIELGKNILKSFPGLGYVGFEIIAKNCRRKLSKKNYIVSQIYISPGPNIHFPMKKGRVLKKAGEIIANLLLDV